MTFGDLVRSMCAAAFMFCAASAAAQTATPAPPLSPPSTVDPRPVQTAPVQGVPAQPAPAQPAPAPASPAEAQHPDAVTATETVLNPMPVLSKGGSSSWTDGFDTIVATLKTITAEMDRLGLKRSGDPMIAYNSSDDAGFEFEAQIPFSGATTERPQGGVAVGASYSGRVLKFSYKGSFADMDNTYEAIANYLDARSIEAQDLYIERYVTDPVATPPDALEVDIYVPRR
ncbi:GyrI-like domain-containing protein [Aquabacter sp. CN5-332]|uniref:GyrI-like domain-containing protein n=1 Tax=Aquabacter sp. CN5-332 TaxID=3156608 RepID=UPI0032B3214D